MRLFRHACRKIVQIVKKIQLNSLIFPRTRSVLNNFFKKIISQLRARVGCHFLFFSLSQVGRWFLASQAEILFSIFFSHFFHRENAHFTTQMRGKVQGMQISTLITDSFDVRFYRLIYRRVDALWMPHWRFLNLWAVLLCFGSPPKERDVKNRQSSEYLIFSADLMNFIKL